MRISDWSSDVCSSDLRQPAAHSRFGACPRRTGMGYGPHRPGASKGQTNGRCAIGPGNRRLDRGQSGEPRTRAEVSSRSEEHTSELQSLMRISYAVFCLKKKKT